VTLEQAHTRTRSSARWYNNDPDHSGIAYLHPTDVHASTAAQVITARQAVLDTACTANPDRFRHRPRRAASPPSEAWINKPTVQDKTLKNPAISP